MNDNAEQGQGRLLDTADELVLTMHKRVVTQYATNASGSRELRLYYGDKEISFDEPALFAFGETLGQQSRFVAAEAMGWGTGYPWPRVKELLGTLIDEGVLLYSDDAPVEAGPGHTDGARPSPLPPAETAEPQSWVDCEAITQRLGGRPVESGYLELVIPIFRVAHIALDAEGRQIGEANVFPPALRLDVPTRWRACIYEGTRHQSERPMNVTALKSMRAYWGQMMAALLQVREAYLERFPAARGGWTVGHLERLSVVVLALPAYQLTRGTRPVANGKLHPALSSMFRVTDGLRMTMHQMLFVPMGEPVRAPDAPMNSAEIYAYAERNHSFHSEHGVCAGPRTMVEEFFSVLVDGVAPKSGLPVELDPGVRDALADMDAVIDYALLGLQAYAAEFSVWPAMARAYETLGSIAAAWAIVGPPSVAKLRDRCWHYMEHIAKTGYLATEERRADRDRVYADMYAQATIGLHGSAPGLTLAQSIAGPRDQGHQAASLQLRAALGRHLGLPADLPAGHLADFHACVMAFVQHTQGSLRVACQVQREINTLLGRTQPVRPFDAADLEVHIRLRGDEQSPYLLRDLADLLGVDITLDENTFAVEPRAATASS